MRKFVVDGKMEFESVAECAEYIVENGIDEAEYDEMLDECYEMVNICGYEYYPSYALYRLDRIAYDCGLSDYRNSLLRDIEDEIERMENEEEMNFYGYVVVCIEKVEE